MHSEKVYSGIISRMVKYGEIIIERTSGKDPGSGNLPNMTQPAAQSQSAKLPTFLMGSLTGTDAAFDLSPATSTIIKYETRGYPGIVAGARCYQPTLRQGGRTLGLFELSGKQVWYFLNLLVPHFVHFPQLHLSRV